MSEEEYQERLAVFRAAWGGLSLDPDSPGILRADNDTTGILVGRFAPIVAEILNRQLKP